MTKDPQKDVISIVTLVFSCTSLSKRIKDVGTRSGKDEESLSALAAGLASLGRCLSEIQLCVMLDPDELLLRQQASSQFHSAFSDTLTSSALVVSLLDAELKQLTTSQLTPLWDWKHDAIHEIVQRVQRQVSVLEKLAPGFQM